MTRKALKALGSAERHRFTAIYERDGVKNGWTGPEPTIPLRSVRRADTGKEIADHL